MQQKNPISSINSFLNKTFGVPLPKSSAGAFIGPVAPNMSVAPRNDMQANASYPSAPANNEAKNIKYTTPANPAATSTKAPAIAPAKTSTNLPPAGQTFVNNLANNGLSTIPGPYDAATGKLKDVPGSPNSSVTTPEAPKAPESPYLAYLRSMFDPEALKTAGENVTKANTKLSDIQGSEEKLSLSGRHAAEDAYDASGGLKSGAIDTSNSITRKTNRELADLAVQESAAARSAAVYKDTYDTLIGAGKSVFEAETAASKAAQDQANKDRDYKLDETKMANDKAAEDRKFEEDKRQFGLQYALDTKKYNLDATKVANDNPNSSAATAAKDAEASSSLNLINQLISNEDLGSIFGSVGQYKPSLILGAGGNLALNQFNQVKGQLALENRAKLKGQGAVSDFEGRVLDSAASALGRNLSDADGVKQLKQIRGAIATSHGLSADVRVSNPRTNESDTVSADSAAIAKMVKDGLLVEYQ